MLPQKINKGKGLKTRLIFCMVQVSLTYIKYPLIQFQNSEASKNWVNWEPAAPQASLNFSDLSFPTLQQVHKMKLF